MTDKKSRRVVIINNIKSDTIDQAIFILKSESPARASKNIETSVAQEAQEIINKYVRQVERIKGEFPKNEKTKRASSKALPVLLSSLSILCIGLSVTLLYILF